MSMLNVRIPDDLKRQIDDLSRQRRRPTNDLVCEALRRYVVTEQLQAVRRLTVPLAAAQGYLADADVFREVS